MTILVIDVGTSSVRAAAVRADATVAVEHHRPCCPRRPRRGASSSTPRSWPASRWTWLGACWPTPARSTRSASPTNGRPPSCGTGPRASPSARASVGRTCARPAPASCSRRDGIRVAPNASATKAGFLLDLADPERQRDLCIGTVDTWLTWQLSEGAIHATDATNAGGHGPADAATPADWDDKVLDALRIPRAALPHVVDTSGVLGAATALEGAPPIAALVGDQQSSLVGQGCVHEGQAKITFGTGGMLDLHLGEQRPRFERQGEGGCFPIVAWRRDGVTAWGVEAVMLSAGTNVEWLRDDLGIIASAEESHDVASRCETRRRRRLRPCPARSRRAAVGLRRPGHAARPHPWERAPADRASGARGSGRAGRRPRRCSGGRHRSDDPHAARRRRHERQPDVPPGSGRRGAAAGRGVPGAGGHHPGRGVPRRAWPSARGAAGTTSRRRGGRGPPSSRGRRPIGSAGSAPATAPPGGSRS